MMIYTPKLSEAPVETLMSAGLGFVAGKVLNANAGLTAVVFAVSTLANYLFFEAANRWVLPLINSAQEYAEITPEMTYAGICVIVSSVTFVALNQLDVLSRRLAGAFVIMSLASFASRLRIIYGS